MPEAEISGTADIIDCEFQKIFQFLDCILGALYS
jgi:hypothetical protein